MADCELIKVCIFFNNKMKNYPLASDRLKERYCREDNRECARHMVFKALGKDKIPTTLFPAEKSRARRIIAMAK